MVHSAGYDSSPLRFALSKGTCMLPSGAMSGTHQLLVVCRIMPQLPQHRLLLPKALLPEAVFSWQEAMEAAGVERRPLVTLAAGGTARPKAQPEDLVQSLSWGSCIAVQQL